MAITYIDGDLFDTDVYYIGHGCNAQGVMGSGIAKIVRNRYPTAYNNYIQEHAENGLIVGDVHLVKCEGKTIVNIISQRYYGRDPDKTYVSYDGLQVAFKKLNTLLAGKQLALPLIGAGLANGDWKVIETIIERQLVEVDVRVYRYKD